MHLGQEPWADADAGELAIWQYVLFPDRHFKGFFYFIQTHHAACFPNLVSYTRFVELTKGMLVPLMAFFNFVKAPPNDVSFIDSTAIGVCKTKR